MKTDKRKDKKGCMATNNGLTMLTEKHQFSYFGEKLDDYDLF